MVKTSNFTDRTGEKWITNEGYTVEIIEYFGARNCTICFPDGNIVKGIEYNHLKKGNVKNPLHRSVCGVGYLGIGKYKSTSHSDMYNIWIKIFERCYSENSRWKYMSYKDCSVIEHWHCFQNFAEWFDKNHKSYMKGWHLDKDILIKGNKIYSPETCAFVPPELNIIFTKRQNSRGKYPIGVKADEKKFKATINKNGGTLSPRYV